MGLDERNYYSDSADWGKSWTPDDDRPGNRGGGGMRGPAGRSIVITLIIINVVIAVLDLFTPKLINTAPNSINPNDSFVVSESDGSAVGENPTVKPKTGSSAHWLSRSMGLDSEVFSKPWLGFKVLTYGFAHSSLDSSTKGLMHIVFNMLILFMLGRAVEARLGSYEFLRFYLVSIVFAGLVFLVIEVLQTGNPRYVVGASGAVTAVVMLFIFMYPHEKLLLFGIYPIKAWILGVVLIVMDLFNALSSSDNVAVEAHFAGAAFAAAYYYYKWNLRWMRIEKIGELFSSKPKLKVHSVGPDPKLQSDADEILRKINEQGEQSLTAKERRTLKKYSKKIRETRDD